jgi:hyaluronan synthase
VTLVGLALWSTRHVASTMQGLEGDGHRFGLIYTLAFLLLVWQLALCFREPVHRTTDEQQRALDCLRVAVLVPAYNEDAGALHAGLLSLLEQNRRPDHIVVVDDGSTKVDYSGLEAWFTDAAREAGIAARWVTKANGGKRSAQAAGVLATPDADIYLTVDSDALLDADALGEGLKPFADDRVQSVAGIVVALNNRYPWRAARPGSSRLGRLVRNACADLLCRTTDLWFVVGQLVDRSAMSTMGGVLVNSGPLALYRAAVIRDNLDGYLNESFFGRGVEFSDDSMLALYARHRGRTVQQPSAFAFTLMPETFDQHKRQYMRWMRGAFIRSWWRFRYLPMDTYAYWGHLLAWIQMTLSSVIFVALFVVWPIREAKYVSAWPILLAVPILIGYGQSLRYLNVRRSDQSVGSQVATFLLTPVATVYAFTGLRLMRWWAMLTPLKTGWGTRENVEVRLVQATDS